MDKATGGWTLQRDRRTGIYYVRFRHAGERFNRSTGTTVRREAQRAAAEIFERVTSGQGKTRLVTRAPKLDILAGQWLDAHAPGRTPETIDMYETHMLTHIEPHFGKLERMTSAGCAEYMRRRLGEVHASTVRKEMSAIRMFLTWCHDEAFVLPEPIMVPSVPKRATGTPVKATAKVRVDLTREQVDALLAAVPERGRFSFPARAYVTVSVETGLRRATMCRLSAPEHYHVGASRLTITPDIIKTKDAWVLPLSKRAIATLDSVCPEKGLIFGDRDIRGLLATASKSIGLPEHLAGRVSYHDLRHFFITDTANSGAPLPATQYLSGHKHASTTSRYIHASLGAAEDALRVRDGTPAGTRAKDGAKKATRGSRGSPSF